MNQYLVNRENPETYPMNHQQNLNGSIFNQAYPNYIQVTNDPMQYSSQDTSEHVYRISSEGSFAAPIVNYAFNSSSNIPIQNENFPHHLMGYSPSTVMTTHVQYGTQQQIQRPESNDPQMIQTNQAISSAMSTQNELKSDKNENHSQR